MSIKLIIIFFIGMYVGAELAYYFIYSPKAQIKRLWKRIHKLSELDGKLSRDTYPTFVSENYFFI